MPTSKQSVSLRLLHFKDHSPEWILSSAIAQKQFSQAEQLCIFRPSNYQTVIPMHNDLYLVYLDTQQFPTYNCNRNPWQNTTAIKAGISLITVPYLCELTFRHYQIMANEPITSLSVIKLFTLSSVSPDSRISSTNIIAIIAISAISIVDLIVILLIIKQLILFYFFWPPTTYRTLNFTLKVPFSKEGRIIIEIHNL